MNAFEVGDLVEIVSIPRAVIEDQPKFPETLCLFERALNKRFHIRSTNQYSFLELWVHNDGSEDNTGCVHSIWIEPTDLKKIR